MIAELAIANNQAWYLSLFRAHGIANSVGEHYWSTDAQPPPYHSHLITRTRGATAREAQLRRLSELATNREGRGWGFKDSFDELPAAALENLGLRLLFRATWYGWAADRVVQGQQSLPSAQRVTSAEELMRWEEDWRQSSPVGGPRVFPEALLMDASLDFYVTVLDGRRVGGFALNGSAGAIGLSNVFQLEGSSVDPGVFVRDCARQARALHPRAAIVGYGPEAELMNLRTLGFVPLGPLAVWTS